MNSLIPPLVVALAVGGGALVACLRQRPDRLGERLRDLSPQPKARTGSNLSRLTRDTFPQIGTHLLPLGGEARTRLQRRLIQSGLYNRPALKIYLGVKTALLFLPWVAGLMVGLSGWMPMLPAVAGGGLLSAAGLVAPSLWLDGRVARRQSALRRGLPDVLDVLVLCLEPGLSLPAAFKVVTEEVQTSCPTLGFELRIVQREIQLGRSLGQALRSFAERSGMSEVGVIASTVEQTERLGASLVRSLRLQAEQMRFRRAQHAEERAQKAGGKILFPTILLIFPSIFVILLGPAALQVQRVLEKRDPPKAGPAARPAPAHEIRLQYTSKRGSP